MSSSSTTRTVSEHCFQYPFTITLTSYISGLSEQYIAASWGDPVSLRARRAAPQEAREDHADSGRVLHLLACVRAGEHGDTE